MEKKYSFQMKKKKKNLGQSTVEYILLLGVVMVMILAILKSPFFKLFFGDDSAVFAKFRRIMEHSYRHGFPGELPNTASKGTYTTHESYTYKGDQRFFFPLKYPKN